MFIFICFVTGVLFWKVSAPISIPNQNSGEPFFPGFCHCCFLVRTSQRTCSKCNDLGLNRIIIYMLVTHHHPLVLKMCSEYTSYLWLSCWKYIHNGSQFLFCNSLPWFWVLFLFSPTFFYMVFASICNQTVLILGCL